MSHPTTATLLVFPVVTPYRIGRGTVELYLQPRRQISWMLDQHAEHADDGGSSSCVWSGILLELVMDRAGILAAVVN
jgi:hypothetical protein